MNALEFTYNGHGFFVFNNYPDDPMSLCFSTGFLENGNSDDVMATVNWFLEWKHLLKTIVMAGDYTPFDRQTIGSIASDFTVNHMVRAAAATCIRNFDRHSEWVEQQMKRGTRRARNAGYIYLARSDSGHYKIGQSKKPKERIKVFDTIMPIRVELVHTIPADNSFLGESLLHEKYAHKRFDGEWFSLNLDDVEEIKRIGNFAGGLFTE